MKSSVLIIALCCCLITPAQASGPVIRIRAPQSEYDASHDYFQQLIETALQKSSFQTRKPPIAQINIAPYMVQRRALDELGEGNLIDIYWAGTNAQREKNLRAIRIPLIRGLLGYRVFATHKKNVAKLQQVKSIEDLKAFSFCQGAHWPDTNILAAAGLKVQPDSTYENMFRKVAAGRCDAFPRSIYEAHSELEIRKANYNELTVFDSTVLYYPFPMYFFVKKDNEVLAQRLEEGLERMIDDGSFERHIRRHPVTRHLFPLESWMQSRHFITIDNPFLPAGTNINDTRYWVMPPK